MLYILVHVVLCHCCVIVGARELLGKVVLVVVEMRIAHHGVSEIASMDGKEDRPGQ